MSAFSRGDSFVYGGVTNQRLAQLAILVISFLVDLSHHVSVDEYMFFEVLQVQ